jgi:hypothetical protein
LSYPRRFKLKANTRTCSLCTLELIVNFTELICIDGSFCFLAFLLPSLPPIHSPTHVPSILFRVPPVDRWELDARSPTYSFWDGSRFNDQDIKRLIQRTDLPILFQRKSTEQLQAPLKVRSSRPPCPYRLKGRLRIRCDSFRSRAEPLLIARRLSRWMYRGPSLSKSPVFFHVMKDE